MKYLLDTHSFLWTVTDFEKLSRKVQEVVADMENEVFVSVVTFWEMSIKHSVGKIDLAATRLKILLKLQIKANYQFYNSIH